MIALSIIAAGIIAIAAALFLRPSFELRTADQRGLTLQTLIVTAVLVLVAGAAGVVIIAITNNASDNLEGQNPGVNSRCEPWEIFDPLLSADGRGGGEGGIESSAIGCLRVCYVEFGITADVKPLAANIKNGDDLANGSSGSVIDLKNIATSSTGIGILLFSWTDETTTASGTVHKLPVSKARSVDIDGNGSGEVEAKIAKITKDSNVYEDARLNNLEIRVAANQRYCEVWNNTTDQQEFRSKN